MAKDNSKRTKASRIARIEAEQEVHPVILADSPTSEYRCFEELIAVLYGPTGIGKTTFGITIPGSYVIATEPVNNPTAFRRSEVPNWPTFKAFIDKAEANPRFVEGVSMWVIDTIDVLVRKCMSSICFEWGLSELSDEGYARAWMELKEELIFNICRLRYLGPGVLIISHERQRPFIRNRVSMTKDSMDLSDSICNAVHFLATTIMHMRYVDQSKTKAELGHMRCLSIRGTDDEDAKDNTNKLIQVCAEDTGIIKFKTEQRAVEKILSCFKDTPDIKKHKKSKKKSKKKKAKAKRR